jgi:hypothetical protein
MPAETQSAIPMKIRSLKILLPTVSSAMGLLLLLVTWHLGDGGAFLLIGFAAWIAVSETACRFLSGTAVTPYLAMALSPLLLVHYSSVGDFRIRLACFFMLAYILVLAWRGPGCRLKIFPGPVRPGHIWLVSLLVFALAAAALYSRGIQLSGDEPHYVMIAQSLVEDGDFDLRNNLEKKTYFAYLPVEIRFHGSVRSGRYHSFHLPGMSFLLLPFFYLFRLLGGAIPAGLYFRLVAALIHSFFALGLFLVLRTSIPGKDGSRLFLFFLATFPLVFQAVHLFPELPAATLMVFAYVSGRDKKRYFLAGLLLAGIPWLHLKYIIPAAIMALFFARRIWQDAGGPGARARRLASFFSAQAASLAALGLYSRMLYGSFDPRVISPEKNFLAIPFKFRIETLLSFFLDQRDGLLVYAPVFLLVFLAFKKEVREKIRDFPLLAAIFVSYVLFHAFTTVRGGYSPAARPTLFVLWIMVVFLSAWRRYALAGMGRTLFRFLAGMTVFATAWLFYYPLFLYQPVTREVSQRASALLLFLGSEAVGLTSLFPSFLKASNAAYLPNWVWLGLLAAGLGLYCVKSDWPKASAAARLLFPPLGLGLLLLLCLYPHVQLQTRYQAGGLSFYCNSRNFAYKKEAKGFKILAGQDYDLFIDTQGSAARRLDLRLLNSGRVALRVKNGRRILLAENRAEENRIQCPMGALQRFSLGRKKLIHLGLEAKGGAGPAFFWLELR